MTTGLILGKFAPFHAGHQSLIEKALREVDRLVVIIYDAPSVTTIPLPIRANWIRDLYPVVDVLEDWSCPVEAAQDLTLRILEERRITHFYHGESSDGLIKQPVSCVVRRIDPDPYHLRVESADVRSNPFAHRQLIPPRVYPDLVSKVVFLGAPSTGKTTLCSALAAKYDTNWMPEYGKEYWEEHQVNRRLTPEQLYEIGKGHREREDQLILESNRFLFVDTEAIITLRFALYYGDPIDPRLAQLADESPSRYDLFFFCEDDIPYEDTWDRSGAVFRSEFHRQIRSDLLQRRVPFISIKGSLEERIGSVANVLDQWQTFTSVSNHLRQVH